MKCAAFAVLLAAFVGLAAAPPAAQGVLKRKPVPSPATAGATRGETPRPAGTDEESARETREALGQLLRQYPPSLAEVLRLDPSLLTNSDYLAPYSALAAFLTQHPEVAHNPGFFIGDVRFHEESTASQKVRLIENVLAGVAMFLGFVTLVSVAAWLLKALVDHRRWLRLSKVQTDAHTKLLDRFTSNEDLLAYIQTPVGRRFLESAPIPLDAGPRTIAAPIGRILWSVQAGFVVGLAGIGLLLTAAQMNRSGGDAADVAPVVFGIAMLALAIGVGFVLSAFVAYQLSRRLGLIERPSETPHA